MNFLQMVQLATRLYLKHAYPDGLSSSTREKVEELGRLTSEKEIFDWDGFEREGSRYNLRLGNTDYPHMKLVFTMEGGKPVFYVDAHDSHFKLPPGLPGYEKLVALRERNKKLKKTIESEWLSAGLPIFGRTPGPIQIRKICKGLRVLAIDDEPQILDMLSIIVTSMGAEMIRALRVSDARRVIENDGLPDLIFCDIMMPEESGYDFVHWLHDQDYEIPTYFITGLNLAKIDTEGVTAVLQKPFTAKSVMNIVKNVCKRLDENSRKENEGEGTA